MNVKKQIDMYLENIYSPTDVKKLSFQKPNNLSHEIRVSLLRKLSAHGGHFGSNFGMVEATIALYCVFNSPKDKIVHDVSHQSYVHKMLTGRKGAFLHPAEYDHISGYSESQESGHDFFVISHTSISVSLASGLVKGRDLIDGNGNIITATGDGSLNGGEAFGGLDYVAELGTSMVIIVNDNQMSIAENHGSLYKNLKDLRDSNGQCEYNLFKAMRLDYMYVNDGNCVEALVEAFSKARDVQHPIVVHINTSEGKGYEPAEQDEETYHQHTPFDLETGRSKMNDDAEDYSKVATQYLLKKVKEDKCVITITSGTPAILDFTPDRHQEIGKQFIDVDIAEEHAVALAPGIAANGGKPVYGVYNTFTRRSYDQLSQDLYIDNDPAVLLVFWGTLPGMNDVTHLYFFNIPLISNIPNMVYLTPTCKEEYLAVLGWSIYRSEHPVAIRTSTADVISCGEPMESDYSNLNRYRVTHRDSKVAILALSFFFRLGQSVLSLLKEKTDIDAILINPRYITGMDSKLMDELKADRELVITLGDGVLDGGFGGEIACYYGATDTKMLNYGAKKEFVDRYNIRELLHTNHLADKQIVEDILSLIG